MSEANVVCEWTVGDGKTPARLMLDTPPTQSGLRLVRGRKGDIFVVDHNASVLAVVVQVSGQAADRPLQGIRTAK